MADAPILMKNAIDITWIGQLIVPCTSKPLGAIDIEISNNYDSFIDYYVDKTTCPGYCFFQFIDGDSGHFLRNSRSFSHFNATIGIICDITDPNETPPWKIVNGHLYGCSLQTRTRTVRITDSLLACMFNTNMDNLKQQSYSSLYSICLCNTTLSPSFSECQRNVSIELYPVSHFPLSLAVVRDFLISTEAQVKLFIFAVDNQTKYSYPLSSTVNGCTTMPALQFSDGIVSSCKCYPMA